MENKLNLLVEPYEFALEIDVLLSNTFDSSKNPHPNGAVIKSLVELILKVIGDDLESRLNKLVPRDESKVVDVAEEFKNFCNLYGLIGMYDVNNTSVTYTYEMIWEMIENCPQWESFFHKIHSAVSGNDFQVWKLEAAGIDSGLFKLVDYGDYRMEEWYTDHFQKGHYVASVIERNTDYDEDGIDMGT